MDQQSELIKEVFARFGTAYYESEVLHRGLCNIYALATFDKPESVTRARIDEKLTYTYSLTLGQVIKESKHLFPIDIQEQLDLALSKRNFLAHHFWFERNHLMFDEKGLSQLQNELIEFTEFFDSLDKTISDFFRPIRQKFGISDEMIQEIYERLVQGEEDEPLITQRMPKKQERIVKVWDAEVADGLTTQIFETDDGNLWQLSDIGLGWSKFAKPEPYWKINVKIQQYLPASINPRPSISESWNYEFQLMRGAIFWVKPGRREKSYTWGVKEPLKT
jgi:hypothetical protein